MTDTKTTDIKVSGMTCGHCVKAVTSELQAVPGVTNVVVSLNPEGLSDVEFECTTSVTPDLVSAAIDEAGYELIRKNREPTEG